MHRAGWLRSWRAATHLACGLIALLATTGASAEAAPAPVITLIIDDLGYNRYWGERVIRIDAPITCAVLPHSPHSKHLARLAHGMGKEVILHAPMANTRGRPLGPGAMTEQMSELELLSKLLWNLAAVPYARGINNHMGSLLTQREQPMRWVMRELRRNDLFFVDSRTTGDSVAPELALEERVPHAVRDVFLDHERDETKIGRAFEKTIRIAREKGRAVAIGHPHPETVQFLEANVHRLRDMGISIIPASQMALLHVAARLRENATLAGAQARAPTLR